MISALRYEPQGQRFAPQEQRPSEEQHRHIHLHLHLHLSFRTRQRHSTHLGAIGITRIFAALVGATIMAISLILVVAPLENLPSTPLFNLGGLGIFWGLVLSWGAVLLGGIPLLVYAWNSTKRIRYLVAIPIAPPILITLLLTFFGVFPIAWLGGTPLGQILYALALPLLLYAYPIISTLMLNRAVRRSVIADRWLRFASWFSYVVVGGMILAFLGVLFWSISLFQISYHWYIWLLYFGICLTVIIAVYTLFSRSRSQNNAQPRPQDDPPYYFASYHSHEE